MSKEHQYQTMLKWTGNSGVGTTGYKSYERSYTIKTGDKPEILGSSDPAFRGDSHKYNPEDLLVASLSSCHMLWYLHLCSESGIVVTNYVDKATAIMIETANGGGRFKQVTLNPIVTVKKRSMMAVAIDLHKKANELCFIANSVNFPVLHVPQVEIAQLI